MVYRGKPSGGCQRCRQRRIKCDQQPSGCGQCARLSLACSGYRNQLDLMFKDESENVVRKAKVEARTSKTGTVALYSEQNVKRQKLRLQKESRAKQAPANTTEADTAGAEEISRGNDTTWHNSRLGFVLPSTATWEMLDISTNLGGIRLDLVESYTGQDRLRVIQCLNYYINFCGPNYVWGEEMIATGSIQTFSRHFFQTSLAEPVFLEGILTICQSDLELRTSPTSKPSRAVLQHHTRALKLLRQRLSDKGSYQDDVILATVISMVTYDMTYGDWVSYEIHLKCLREIVKLRGGLENLGWQGWFAYAYTWAELRWMNHLAQQAQRQIGGDRGYASLEYIEHPFLPDICSLISKLPFGFQEVALSKLLSVQVISFLAQVSEWNSNSWDVPFDKGCLGKHNIKGLALAGQCADLIGSNDLNQGESLICIATMAYLLSFIEGPAGHSRGLEDQAIKLETLDLRRCNAKCRMWIAIVIASANESVPTPLPSRWLFLDQVMGEESTRKHWPEAIKMLRKFFWAESYEGRWEKCWEAALQRRFLEKDEGRKAK